MLEGKTEYPAAVRSQFKHHLVSNTNMAVRSAELRQTRIVKGISGDKILPQSG